MSINRRQFLILTTATAACAATDCLGMTDSGSSAAVSSERVVDAGPVGNFAADGVYDSFRDQGFFVIRKNGKLVVLSAYCTHRRSPLKAEPDCSFYCKRHGATFAPSGQVTKGPAMRDLPTLITSVNEAGHLLVHISVT